MPKLLEYESNYTIIQEFPFRVKESLVSLNFADTSIIGQTLAHLDAINLEKQRDRESRYRAMSSQGPQFSQSHSQQAHVQNINFGQGHAGSCRRGHGSRFNPRYNRQYRQENVNTNNPYQNSRNISSSHYQAAQAQTLAQSNNTNNVNQNRNDILTNVEHVNLSTLNYNQSTSLENYDFIDELSTGININSNTSTNSNYAKIPLSRHIMLEFYGGRHLVAC